MNIGDHILLHNIAFPQNSLKEDEPDRFVLVEVIESRDVPGMFGKDTYKGYRARGEDGRFYLCNWTSFPDDSATPTWMWFREMPESEMHDAIKQDDAAWYDVTQGLPFITFKPVWLDRYSEYVHWCPKHARLNYGECFNCKYTPDCHIPPSDYSWKGWK